MNRLLKTILVVFAVLVVLTIAAVLVVPALINVEQLRPKIQTLVTEKTGYPLTLGGDIDLSLFPWVGLSFTDLQLDNPQGFEHKTFVRIAGFEAHLKVLPLLAREIEIDRFVVEQPEIFLEKRGGSWNWQKPATGASGTSADTPEAGKSATPGSAPPQQPTEPAREEGGFSLKSLVIGEFSITNGRVVVDAPEENLKREISDFEVTLTDVSLEAPINLAMEARLDGKPLSVTGSVGPLGADPGVGRIELELEVQALETVALELQGSVADLGSQPSYQLVLGIEPFSPRRLFSGLGLDFPVQTTDPRALENFSLQANLDGDLDRVAISESRLALDETTIDLDLAVATFSSPDITFTIGLDRLDLDRYLPPAEDSATPPAGGTAPSAAAASNGAAAADQADSAQAPDSNEGEGTTAAGTPPPSPQTVGESKINYEPLRNLAVKGTLAVGTLGVHGGTIEDLALELDGRDGLFHLASLAMSLYQGSINSTGSIDVRTNVPAVSVDLDLSGVQAGPLLRDFAKKEIIEGRLAATLSLALKGEQPEYIKRTLNGSGDLRFQDGALLGIDLAELARTIKSGFTLEQQGEKPKTDFAELHVPFTITDGLVTTPDTSLKSPFIRMQASGTADLVSEQLDLRVKPKLVGTIKGQGDQEDRTGIALPIIVGGTFEAPEFSPDLEALVKDQAPDEEEIREIIKTGEITPERKEQLKEEVEKAKGLLKGLFGN